VPAGRRVDRHMDASQGCSCCEVILVGAGCARRRRPRVASDTVLARVPQLARGGSVSMRRSAVTGRFRCAMLAVCGGLAVSGSLSAQATPRRLTGHVTDVDGGAPIPAVTVLVAGTTIGGQTSDSGTFALRV